MERGRLALADYGGGRRFRRDLRVRVGVRVRGVPATGMRGVWSEGGSPSQAKAEVGDSGEICVYE